MDCVLSIVDEGRELRALAATTSGTVIGGATRPGPANVRVLGPSRLTARIHELVLEVIPPPTEGVCLAATAALAAEPDWVRMTLARLVPLDAERVLDTSVERCALAGSLGTVDLREAVVVRGDVGSRGWAVSRTGRETRRGGFGESLGDEGSDYWIGLRGIRAALRSLERRHRNTLLRNALLEHFRVKDYRELLAPEWEAPRLDRYQIADFAQQVFEAGEHDDEVALEILTEAGRDLATLALALANEAELGETAFSVLPCGTTLRRRGACVDTFIRTLKNKTAKANLLREGMGAPAGGALLALQHLGLKVRPEVAELLRTSIAARS